MATTLLAIAGFNADAGLVVIDDFNSGDQYLEMTTANGLTMVTDTNSVRTLTSTLLAMTNPIYSAAEVGFDYLTLTNGAGEQSEVTVAWDIAANTISAGGSNHQLVYSIIESDGNPTNFDLYFEGLLIGNSNIASNTTNQDLIFDVATVDFSLGGELKIVLTGNSGWDMQLDAIGLRYDDAVPPSGSPEPAGFALFGLGLLMFGMRKKV